MNLTENMSVRSETVTVHKPRKNIHTWSVFISLFQAATSFKGALSPPTGTKREQKEIDMI